MEPPTSCRPRNRALRLALVGPRGAGKTTLAPQLAQRLGIACVDLDSWIEDEVQEPLAAWIQSHGWDAFRALESKALERVPRLGSWVVACGAGAVEKSANRALLSRLSSDIFWLDIAPEEQARRLQTDTTRPRLEPSASPQAELEVIDRRRRLFYQQIATTRVDAQGSPDEVLDRCLTLLGAVDVRQRH